MTFLAALDPDQRSLRYALPLLQCRQLAVQSSMKLNAAAQDCWYPASQHTASTVRGHEPAAGSGPPNDCVHSWVTESVLAHCIKLLIVCSFDHVILTEQGNAGITKEVTARNWLDWTRQLPPARGEKPASDLHSCNTPKQPSPQSSAVCRVPDCTSCRIRCIVSAFSQAQMQGGGTGNYTFLWYVCWVPHLVAK